MLIVILVFLLMVHEYEMLQDLRKYVKAVTEGKVPDPKTKS